MASTSAILIYARGLAYAALGMVAEAEAEQALFIAAAASDIMQLRQLHNNKVTDLLDVHALVLSGKVVVAHRSTTRPHAHALTRLHPR